MPKLTEYLAPFLRLFKDESIQQDIVKKSLDRWAGLETEEQNPDRLLNETGRNITLYDSMLMDDRIDFALQLKKRMILANTYKVEPVSEDEKDVAIAEDVSAMLGITDGKYPHDLGYSFGAFIDNALDAMVYGFKVAEKIFRYSPDGKLYTFSLRHRHSLIYDFNYDEYGGLSKLLIGNTIGGVTTIEGVDKISEKFMIFTYPYVYDGNFYGESDLMTVFEQWRAKRHIFRSRNRFLEAWGMPIPEVVYDSDTTSSTEKGEIQKMLKNFQENMYILQPGQRVRGKNGDISSLEGKFKFTIHEKAGGSNSAAYENAISQIDSQITRAMLIPDKLGFTDSASGSYNIGEVQFDILQQIVTFMHRWTEATVDPLIRQLVDLNYGKQEKYPCFKFDDVAKINPELLKILIDAKVVNPEEKWIRRHTGIPILSQEEKDELEENKKPVPMPLLPGATVTPPVMPPAEMPDNEGDEDGESEKEPEKPVKEKHFKDYRRSQNNPFRFKAAATWMDEQEAEFSAMYAMAHEEAQAQLVRQVENKKLVENKDYKGTESLRINKATLKVLFTSAFIKWFIHGKIDGIEETVSRADGLEEKMKLERMKDEIEVEWLDRQYIDNVLKKYGALGALSAADKKYLSEIRNRGFYITGLEEERLVKITKNIVDEGIRVGSTTAEVTAKLKGALSEDLAKNALTIARTNISTYYNTGRANFFTGEDASKFIEAYQFQAIIDDVTTDFCREHDGQIMMASDPSLAVMWPPEHFGCRSTMVPILIGENEDEDSFFSGYKDEFDRWGTNVTATQPAKGFGGN